MPDESPGKPVDIRHGQGVAVASSVTQNNYFVTSSVAKSEESKDSSARRRSAGALRVYISSAPGPLAPYWHAAVEACRRLHLTPVSLDPTDLHALDPAQLCLAEIESCDVFVLLFARQYLTQLPGANMPQAEWEFRCAAGCPQMPILSFVAYPTSSSPPSGVGETDNAQGFANFMGLVNSRAVPQRLADIEAFREDLIVSLGGLAVAPGVARDNVPGDEDALAPVGAPAFHAVPAYAGSAPFTGRDRQLAILDDWGRSKDPVMVVESIGGAGKSALTWQWAQDRAPAAIRGLAGRLWWSFYDGSASMTRFMQELLSYTTRDTAPNIRRMSRGQLLKVMVAELNSRPYLIILDGFERLLAAYHQFDPSKLHDEDVEQEPSKRSMIEPYGVEIISSLSNVTRSKILISTRLMPTALEQAYARRPGVRHLRLPGLTNSDTQVLLGRLGVHGSDQEITRFFSPLENHPLLVGVVAGLVRDYRAQPGRFDRWAADPEGGARLTVSSLDLTQRRTHILQAAFAGLEPRPRKLLGFISVLPGSAQWETLVGINPFRPHRSEPDARAKAQLVTALKDLEDRGLLWWERWSNTYDLHPIIRAYAYDQLEDIDRFTANDRVRDHFQALPPEDPDRAASVEDLTQTITILRALIETDNSGDASRLWNRFNATFMFSLSAYSTVAELLTPLAVNGSMPVRASLAVAYHFLGRYDDAVRQNADRLVDYLRDGQAIDAQHCLSTMCFSFHKSGGLIAARRCIELQTLIARRTGRSDVSLDLSRARLAAALGQARKARKLLRRAEHGAIPSGFRWFRDYLDYLPLYLALETRRSLSDTELLSISEKQYHSTQFRRDITEMRAELCLRQGNLKAALIAAQEHDQLCRNAGLEVAPGRTALILARLKKTPEAEAAVEDAVSRLTRLHPAQRPHYHLAQTFLELGEYSQAASHAYDAFLQAWADGPPNRYRWELVRARNLLLLMDEQVPSPPTQDPAQVRIPREDEIRALIMQLSPM
jgi:Domain of unknown function (DUF4062)